MKVLANTTRKSRKQHTCEVCYESIHVGHLYHDSACAHDGTVYNYRTHLFCSVMFQHAFSYWDIDHYEGMAAEGVWEWLREMSRDKAIESVGTPVVPYWEKSNGLRE